MTLKSAPIGIRVRCSSHARSCSQPHADDLLRIWDGRIARDPPELRAHLEQLLAAVQAPDHIEPVPEPGET
jgi:hypothetical protein